MLIKYLLSALLFHQSIGYLQQSICSDSAFGKCPIRTYCGITNTGVYKCLPCPGEKLCPGDGYIYHEQQLNKRTFNHNAIKYIIHTSNNSYIVSSDPLNRKLFRKKLKRFIKIAKVGLKVAAIVKTGGTAGIAKLAAEKAKQLAIKKGLQCLKNGLSNFCNGKKKGAKPNLKLKPKVKPRIGSAGGIVKKTKPAAIQPNPSTNLRRGVKKPVVTGALTPRSPVTRTRTRTKIKPNSSKTTDAKTKTKAKGTKAKGTKAKGTKAKGTKAKGTKAKGTKAKGTSSKSKPLGKGKRKIPPRGIKNIITKPPSSSNPCGNIFDDFANKVNNVTNNALKNPVNKGRDWLKKNIGGNKGNCNDQTSTSSGKRPIHLRGNSKRNPEVLPKRKPKLLPPGSISDDTSNNSGQTDDSPPTTRPVTKTRPKARPVTKTDDSQPVPRHKYIPTRPKAHPVTKTDDSQPVPRHKYIPTRPKARPVTKTDDSQPVPIPIPIPNALPATRTDDSLSTTSPTRKPASNDYVVSNRIPVRIQNRKSNSKLPTRIITTRPTRPSVTEHPTRVPIARPTRIPIFILTVVPTRMPNAVPTIRPTHAPSLLPTRVPTPMPTRNPTPHPSVRPTQTPTTIAEPPTMIPGNGLSWAVFSSTPTFQSNIPPTRVPTVSMFSVTTPPPTTTSPTRATPSPSLLKNVTQKASPTQRPTMQPSVQPTITPSFRSTLNPTEIPTQASIITLNPTIANAVSSINSASNSQTGVSSTAISVGISCVILVIIVIAACIFIARKNSKEKMSPYQIWTTHYSGRDQQLQNLSHNQNVINHPPINVKEEIHHFYNKSHRPSFNQNTVFTPHVSGRISSRNSQIVLPIGSQKNVERRSFSRGPLLHDI
jgi:hypothetical protein